MRIVTLLCSAIVVLAPAVAGAQTPPPDSVSEVLRQKIRPGTVQDYEAARKKHMTWHKAQNDPWAWEVFEVMTGPDTGSYLISSGDHQWKDMEAWVAKMADADAADSQASMGPYIAGTQREVLDPAQCHQPAALVRHPISADHGHDLSREAWKRCRAANGHREGQCRPRCRQVSPAHNLVRADQRRPQPHLRRRRTTRGPGRNGAVAVAARGTSRSNWASPPPMRWSSRSSTTSSARTRNSSACAPTSVICRNDVMNPGPANAGCRLAIV